MNGFETVQSILEDLFGPPSERNFAVRYWDGRLEYPKAVEPEFTLVIEHPGSIRKLLWPPSEVSIAEAYIYGDFDVEGSLEAAAELPDIIGSRLHSVRAISHLIPPVLSLPARNGFHHQNGHHEHNGEADGHGSNGNGSAANGNGHRSSGKFLLGRRHNRRRDAAAIRFHYDVSNDFYSRWLDPRMIYSCGYFPTGEEDLAEAQTAKLEHTCRKLRLKAGERLLDIGCGWGGMIMYAAEKFGVEALGITLSEAQAELARERIAEAGLADRCRVEIRDYRDLPRKPAFDKIVSIGMVEHVGHRKLPGYFEAAHRALRVGGLFLNHGIVTISPFRSRSVKAKLEDQLWRRDVFIDRYVFPDGKLVPSAEVLTTAEDAHFELRDVESLREHYIRTLRHWVSRLESHQDELVRMVGEETYRVWRLYMSASARGFATGAIGIIQSLLSKPSPDGRSHLPLSRADLYSDGGRLEIGSRESVFVN